MPSTVAPVDTTRRPGSGGHRLVSYFAQVSAPIAFDLLSKTDLLVEQVYLGGTAGHSGDDPLAVILPVGNQGGFRYAGSPLRGNVRLVVLYTSGVNEDWPDVLDPATGTFTYYGDNRAPGHELHDTPGAATRSCAPPSPQLQVGPRAERRSRRSSCSNEPECRGVLFSSAG